MYILIKSIISLLTFLLTGSQKNLTYNFTLVIYLKAFINHSKRYFSRINSKICIYWTYANSRDKNSSDFRKNKKEQKFKLNF